jgi:hypothetical protein
MVTGFDGVVDVALERVEQFFGQQKGTAPSQSTLCRLKTTETPLAVQARNVEPNLERSWAGVIRCRKARLHLLILHETLHLLRR